LGYLNNNSFSLTSLYYMSGSVYFVYLHLQKSLQDGCNYLQSWGNCGWGSKWFVPSHVSDEWQNRDRKPGLSDSKKANLSYYTVPPFLVRGMEGYPVTIHSLTSPYPHMTVSRIRILLEDTKRSQTFWDIGYPLYWVLKYSSLNCLPT
jgi:hypothetical protein